MFTATNITPAEQIHAELLEMQSFLELPYNSDNPSACMERLVKLGEYMARSGKLKADSEYHYNSIVSSEIMTTLKDALSEKMTPTTLNKFIEAKAKDSKHLVTFSDRVNRSCTHHCENLRTIISFTKQQMNLR